MKQNQLHFSFNWRTKITKTKLKMNDYIAKKKKKKTNPTLNKN